MRKGIISIYMILSGFTVLAQEKTLKYEGQLIVDNDAFTGDLTQDQYYSSGIYGAFRMLMDSSKNAKVIRSYQLNHRMYTPSWIGEDVQAFRDRPYAGILSLAAANEYYFHSGTYLKAQIELGWLGPKSFVGNTQRTWHRWWGMPQPKGWDYQIENSPMINSHLKFIHPFFHSRSFDLSNEVNVSLGSVFNLARYDLVVRLGKLNRMYESAYTSASLGNQYIKRARNEERPTVESYFFYSPGLEYVMYNATLEGNLIGKASPFTVEATKLVWQHRFGAMFSWEVFDLGFIAYFRKKENPEATNHKYVSIRLNQRF